MNRISPTNTPKFADFNAMLSCIESTNKVTLSSFTSQVKIGNKQDKSPKPDAESETSWVLDSLVGFLQGPIWNIPIISFIEQKSIVFEPEKADSQEDEQVQNSTEVEDDKNDVDPKEELEEEYRKIFIEYGSLVDRLLASHMEDLHISLQQFEKACENAKGSLGPQFHKTLFEQIWAANDFEIFKVMMIKRNLELHIQAMTVLTQSLTQGDQSLNNVDGESLRYLFDDDALMDEVMKISLAPRDGDSGLEDNGKQAMVKAALEERDRLEAEKRREEKKLEQALSRAMGGSSESESVERSLGPKKSNTMEKIDENEEKSEKDNQGEEKKGSQDKRKSEKVSKSKKKNDDQKLISSEKKLVDPEEVKNRQEYLRKRRDMILETKQKERLKQVKQLEENELKEKRPKSAKAIRSVIVDELESLPPEDEGLKFRRSLAARLKAEVIEKK